MNFYCQLLCVIVLTFGGKKLREEGHAPPQPSPHAMVLKEHKTMQAPVLVGSMQSLISFVTYRRGFHTGLCSLGRSSFYLLPPLHSPLSC